MKLLQEMKGFAEFRRRQFPPKPTALYLMQLRSHVAQASQSKRRLAVKMDIQDHVDFPHPVKITHLKPGHSASHLRA